MKMLLCFFCLSIPGWISLIYGLACRFRCNRRQRTELEQAEATFIRYEKKKHSSGRYSWKYGYHPVLEFTADSRKYQVQARIHHDEEKLNAGDKVILFYDRNNPEHFHLDEENNEIGSEMVLFRFALVFFVFAAVISILAQVFLFD